MDISKIEISSIPTIVGPSGIGDLSWMYSKLKHVGPLNWCIVGGWPPRSKEFLELLPNVNSVAYDSSVVYTDILTFEQSNGWLPTRDLRWSEIVANGFGRYLLEANKHLELGRRLEEWMIDLPCDFHYKINISDEAIEKAKGLIADVDGPIILANCASDRGAEAWRTWKSKEWIDFLLRVKMETGGNVVLLGGFWDDLTSDVAEACHFKDLVGKTNTEVCIALLSLADLYIGFSSGLGILRTVLNKPAFMLWPDHQIALSTSWAPPEMLDKGTYSRSLYRDVSVVIGRAKRWLRACNLGG